MSGEVPVWLAIIVVVFLLWGCGLTLIGCIGLVRFSGFYERLHMPTLGTSWGIGGILIASMFYTSFHSGRPVFHEFLITVFLVVTTPVTLMMLSRAAAHRDDTNDWSELSGGLLPDQTKRQDEEKPEKSSRRKRRK